MFNKEKGHFFKFCFYTPSGVDIVDLKGSSFIFGRSESCIICIKNETVSNKHIKIFIKDSTVFIEDLNSRNGTVVNGISLEAGKSVPYRLGDLVQIGDDVRFNFYLDKETEKTVSNAELQKEKILGKSNQEIEEKKKKIMQSVYTKSQKYLEEVQKQGYLFVERSKKKAQIQYEEQKEKIQKEKEHLQELKQDLSLKKDSFQQQVDKWKNQIANHGEEKQNWINEINLLKKDHEEVQNQIDLGHKQIEELDLKKKRAEEKVQFMLHSLNQKMQVQLEKQQEKAKKLVQESEYKSKQLFEKRKKRIQEILEQKKKELEQEIAHEKILILKQAELEAQDIVRAAESSAKLKVADIQVEIAKEERAYQKLERDHEKIKEEILNSKEEIEQDHNLIQDLKEKKEQAQGQLTKTEFLLKSSQDEIQKIREEKVKSEEKISEINLKCEVQTHLIEQNEKKISNLTDQRETLYRTIQEEETSLEEDLIQEVAKKRAQQMERIRRETEKALGALEKRKEKKIARISHDIEAQLFSFLKKEAVLTESKRDKVSQSIQSIVKNILGAGYEEKEKEGIQKLMGYDPESYENNKKFWIKTSSAVCGVFVLFFSVFIFRSDIKRISQKAVSFAQRSSLTPEVYLKNAMDKRKKEALYDPEQTEEFKKSYTDNVLYTKAYNEVESQKNQDKWALEATTYLIEELELSENKAAQVLGKEAGLLQSLFEIRERIDKRTSAVRIGEMREKEQQFISQIQKLMSRKKLRRFKEFKKKFYEKTREENSNKSS